VRLRARRRDARVFARRAWLERRLGSLWPAVIITAMNTSRIALQRTRALALSCAFLLALCAPALQAQPDLRRTVGRTIADDPGEHYVFRDERLVSKDGERHYRVRIAVPRTAPPTPRPVLYMLDGNAALMEFTPAMLAQAGQRPDAPVLVFVCYDNDLRIDAISRAYDYTPGLTSAEQQADPQGRRAGGADEFLELLEREVKPRVEAVATIDRQRQALWGHSYGGLFVLHTLMKRPEAFQSYIAVDPALWWDQGRMLQRVEEGATRAFPSTTRVLILAAKGTESAPRPGAGAPPPLVTARSGAPKDAAATLAKRLRTVIPTVAHDELPGSHGATLGGSLPLALQFALGN
jgi:predicted alpha/beta superfamily hydrolase